jgi:hypothetical protein
VLLAAIAPTPRTTRRLHPPTASTFAVAGLPRMAAVPLIQSGAFTLPAPAIAALISPPPGQEGGGGGVPALVAGGVRIWVSGADNATAHVRACRFAVDVEAGAACSDGLDNDCDGLVDGADPDCA